LVRVRRLELRDVDRVIALQSACPEVAQWTASNYERAAQGEMTGWIAEDETGIAGFLVARRLVQETEVLNLAVRAGARRRGVGTSLLREAVDWSRLLGAEGMILEVRASNVAAVKFYERHGFRMVGRRPRYYVDPVDDALLLNQHLTNPGGAAACH
jgi:[ribosomal protein S18]-alanine N-acetyltransferase